MRYSLAPALVVALGISGCAHSNPFATGRDSRPAPYTNLQCSEPGNNEGFSFEIPACDCEAGIRLRYRAHKNSDGRVRVAYELETGYRKSSIDYMKVIADHNRNIRKVFISGRELPPYSRCGDDDRFIWDRARESFRIWERYEPVVRDMFTTCLEEQLDEKVAESQERQDFYISLPGIASSRRRGAYHAGHERGYHGKAGEDRVHARHHHERGRRGA